MHVQAGNKRLLEKNGISLQELHRYATCIYVILDGCYAGRIELADEIRDHTKENLQSLRLDGIRKTVMLTGDVSAVAEKVAGELSLDEWYGELLPQDKVTKMETILKSGTVTAFVGDGVNDAPVLAMADIGIAMGDIGSDAAVEAADVVLLHGRLDAIHELINIAKKTNVIAIQNIVFALGVKFLVLILGAFGVANMWMAVFADVGVSVIAILNAMRTMNSGK
jgi:Cd2+/Zn2+-exporting ATPase